MYGVEVCSQLVCACSNFVGCMQSWFVFVPSWVCVCCWSLRFRYIDAGLEAPMARSTRNAAGATLNIAGATITAECCPSASRNRQ